ncbi:MAG: hypothetical protein WA418_24475 [Bradyrhizobium sp.]
MRRKGFVRQGVEFSCVSITLDRSIECGSVVCLEPRTKARQFVGAQLLDGLLDLFGGCHDGNIALNIEAEKVAAR